MGCVMELWISTEYVNREGILMASRQTTNISSVELIFMRVSLTTKLKKSITLIYLQTNSYLHSIRVYRQAMTYHLAAALKINLVVVRKNYTLSDKRNTRCDVTIDN